MARDVLYNVSCGSNRAKMTDSGGCPNVGNNKNDNCSMSPSDSNPDLIHGLSDIEMEIDHDQVGNPELSEGECVSGADSDDSSRSHYSRDARTKSRLHKKRNRDNSESDSDGDSPWTTDSDSNNDSNNEEGQCSKKFKKSHSSLQGRFNPVADSDKQSWHFSSDQGEFVGKFFTEYIGETSVKESVLKQNPRPSHESLVAPILDDDILELLPSMAKSPATYVDGSFRKIQNKLLDVMGPLGKVWRKVEAMKSADKKSYNAKSIMTLLEQAILMVGQTNVLINHNRRYNVLSRFLRNPKTAKEILRTNETVFRKNRKHLFGQTFYKALHKRARGTKRSKEISRELAPKSRFTNKGKFPVSTSFKRPEQGHKPFQKGPSYKSERGANPRGRGSYRGQRRGSRYVSFYFQNYDKAKHTNSADRKTDTNNSNSGNSFRAQSASVNDNRKPASDRGPTTEIPNKLGKGHARPVNTSDSKGKSDRVFNHPSPNETHEVTSVLVRRNRTNKHRSRDDVKKGCNRNHNPLPSTVCRPCVSTAQKERVKPSDIQLKTVEPVHTVQPFQNGKYDTIIVNHPTRRLDDIHRSQGCVSISSHAQEPQKVLEIPVGGDSVPICGNAIRSEFSPKGIHEIAETSDDHPAETGSAHTDISRRHNNSKSRSRISHSRQKLHNMDIANVGPSDKLGEVHSRALPKSGILGFPSKLSETHSSPSNKETTGHSRFLQINTVPKDHLRQSLIKIDRQTKLLSYGSLPGTPALPPLADAKNKGFAEGQSKLRYYRVTVNRLSRRDSMVGSTPTSMEWQGHDHPVGRSCHYDRCIDDRMGCSVQRDNYPRDVEPTGTCQTHKLPGANSNPICGQGIFKGKKGLTDPLASGQHNHSSTNKQNGGNQIEGSSRCHKTTVGLLLNEGDHTYCRTSAWKYEHHRRSRIQSIPGSQQLEIVTDNLQTNRQDLGHSGSRSVCRPTECSNRQVCQLETRSKCDSIGLTNHQLDEPSGVRFPSILHDRQMLSKSAKGESGIGDDHSIMASPTMVCSGTNNVRRRANSAPTNGRLVDVSTRGTPSTTSVKSTDNDSLESVRKRLESEGFSGDASTLLLESRRPGTKLAYRGPWQKWCSWADQRKIDPFQASVGNIANFLTIQSQRGLEYTTLNTYRSAISAYHPEIDNHPVGQHPRIIQLLRGAFNRKPPSPKYLNTWDVNVVLNWIKVLGNNRDLSLKQLTQKLAMLLALVSAARGSELAKLDPTMMDDTGDRVICRLTKLTKTSNLRNPLKEIVLHEYLEDEHLDVVRCLRDYLARTSALRTNPDQKQTLFLGYTKPHKPVITCSIARWLRDIMTLAGVDTKVYKAHSTRSAATSKALAHGLSTQQIMKCANWARASTFQKFYNKPIVQTAQVVFQRKVMTL